MNINFNSKCFVLTAFIAASLAVNCPVYGNGNTTADAPEPLVIKKSVRKATIKKPVKKAAPKTKKAAPAKAVIKTPVKTSLDRGIELMNQNKYELARPWLQKAVQENRNNAEAWYWYGMYHEKTGKFYEAQYFYTKAVQADPTFDPLSRIVNYPNDANKTALWDPKRPARVYDIPTTTRAGTIIPPNSPTSNRLPKRVDAANNPEIPRVPVYTPPEPGAMPSDGDAWRPSVYVPPSASSVQIQDIENFEGESAAYVPPSGYNNNLDNSGLEAAQNYPQGEPQAIYNPPLPVMPELNKNQAAYQPPAPDNKAQAASAKNVVKTNKSTAKAPTKTTKSSKTSKSSKNSKASKPAATKTASKPKKSNTSASSNSAANNSNNNARQQPQQQSQTQTPRQPQPQNQTSTQPRQQTQSQPQGPRINELPPVGQSTNNGNFEVPLPPVGQN